MKPQIYSMTVAAALAASWAWTTAPTTPPPFEQRWAPVELINGGVKGDRLDRTPTTDAPGTVSVPKPRNNWMANPGLGTKLA